MSIDLYYYLPSAPCRNVLLTAKALDLELNLKEVDLMSGEHLNPEFVELNPQHTIPTLDDNGFRIWESRAIMRYLGNQYGRDSTIYPRDIKKRAIVDQRLDFDLGTFYARFVDYYFPPIFHKAQYDPAKLEKAEEAFKFLDMFLDGQEYAACDYLTIADLALVVSVSNYELMDFDMSPYPNVVTWYDRIKADAPGYEETNGKGAEAFKEVVDKMSST